jgi:acetyltransferase
MRRRRPGAYNHLAILPYPTAHEREWPMRGGGLYTIRPIRPDDADMLQAFMRALSEESRYFRFASTMPELPARMLARYTLIDYDREMALVAVHKERHANADGRLGRERTHHRRQPLHHQPRPDQLRVQPGGVRRLQGPGPGLAADAEHHRRRARQGAGRDRRPDPGQQRQHAAPDEEPGLQHRRLPEDPDFKLASKAL